MNESNYCKHLLKTKKYTSTCCPHGCKTCKKKIYYSSSKATCLLCYKKCLKKNKGRCFRKFIKMKEYREDFKECDKFIDKLIENNKLNPTLKEFGKLVEKTILDECCGKKNNKYKILYKIF